MQVFKTYFKIIKKMLGQLSMYVFIFLGIAIMFSFTSPVKDIENFTQTKTRVAFINEDENSVLINGFKEYLGKYSVYLEPVPNTTEELQDALFYRDVEYIARIPKGFTTDIMNGKPVQIEKTALVDSTSGIYTDMLVDRYFNTAKLYLKNYKDISQSELVDRIAGDLKAETEVRMKREVKSVIKNDTQFFYNYLAYILICVILLGVSSIMMIFNNKNLKRRNHCSPLKNSSMNLQLLLGNIVFSTVCWAVMVICSFVLYKEQMFTTNALFFCINSYVLTLMVLCLSFLVGLFVKGGNSQSAIANVLSLGMSFISGVFVPQELLGKSVLAIARFTPTYWYVRANNIISGLTDFSLENLLPVINSMLIQLGFAVAILSVALVVSKRKQLRGD